MPASGALLGTAAEEELAPPEGRGSGLPAASWEQHLTTGSYYPSQDTSPKTKLLVDGKEGKFGTQQRKQDTGSPKILQEPARGRGGWRKPSPMSRQIEVYKTTSPPVHLSSRTPTERLKPREVYVSYGARSRSLLKMCS